MLPLQQILGEIPPELALPAPDSPRGRILAAARRLFAEQGFNGTSTRMIAEAAAVNLAMIHYYFGSKEQLYERMLAAEVLSGFGGIISSLPPGQTLEDALVTLPVRMTGMLLADPVRARLFRREIADGADYLKRALRALGDHGPIRIREEFRAVYQQAVTQGRVRALSPDAIHECFMAIGFGTVFLLPLLSLFNNRDLSDEATFAEWNHTVTTILRHGLLVEKPK